MKDTSPYWRAHLQTALASEFNSGQVAAMMKNYDKIAAVMNPETAFAIAHESYSGSSTERAVKTVKDWIERELGGYNASHPGVCNEPLKRLRAWVARYNAAVDRCEVLLDGKPALSESELAKVKVKLPGALNPPTAYSATASAKGKAAKMVLEVTD
jgi:hypothetical protein